MATPPPAPSPLSGALGLLGVGGVCLLLAVAFDPIGHTPDSGLISLSPTQARWLLGGFGGFFVTAGVGSLLTARRDTQR